ncbi:MAG: LPXTG cell wall anchor domain-containing protein [Halodesulfurarchaeum sp.]
MDIDRSSLPVLPLSFGLLVIIVVVLGQWGFGIEWDGFRLALALGVLLVATLLVLARRRRRD